MAQTLRTTCRIAIDEKSVIPDYARLVLDSWIGRRCVGFYAKGAAQPGLNLEHVKAFLITCPPLAEQHQITTHLEGAINYFSELIRESEAAILLLKERRSALISAAVTGQIDVRGLVPEASAA
jgi:type I restriction enzyme S subunit